MNKLVKRDTKYILLYIYISECHWSRVRNLCRTNRRPGSTRVCGSHWSQRCYRQYWTERRHGIPRISWLYRIYRSACSVL